MDAVPYCRNKAYEAVIAGLEAKLIPSLLRIVKNRMADVLREENPQLAALWKKAIGEDKPWDLIERLRLREKVQEECEKMPLRQRLRCNWTEIVNKKGEAFGPTDSMLDERGPQFVYEIEGGNVGKLHHDAIQRLKRAASESSPGEIDDMLAQLS